MAVRWPLHPRPRTGEALSSWLARIADAYDLHIDDLLVHDLGFHALSDEQVDLEPSGELLALLSSRTGVSVERIRSMTMKGWTPVLIDSLKPHARLFDRYVKRFSVLLSPKRRSDKTRENWRPWIFEPRFATPMGCPRCLVKDEVPYLRLHWRLPVTASCPKHGIFLEPISRIGTWTPRLAGFKLQRTPQTLCEMDAITEQALAAGYVTLPTVSVRAGVWLRLLRTILDELNTVGAAAQNEHRVLKRVWQASNLPMRVCASSSQTFEALKSEQQVKFLQTAATAVDLIVNRKLETSGRDVVLLGGIRVREKQRPRREAPEPDPPYNAERSKKVAEAFDAAMKYARETPEGARELRALLLLGKGKPSAERIVEVDRILAEDGIIIPSAVI